MLKAVKQELCVVSDDHIAYSHLLPCDSSGQSLLHAQLHLQRIVSVSM